MHRNDGRPGGPDEEPLPPSDRSSARGDGEERAVVERARDEAEADAARRRLRKQGIIPIEPDCRVADLLEPEELLVAVRQAVELERRQPSSLERRGLPGDLYVTTRRLVHIGSEIIHYDLAQIREAVVAGEELMLMLDDGLGVAISVPDPNLLRVEIAAARAADRAKRHHPAAPGRTDSDS
jgi:hypothetical protein